MDERMAAAARVSPVTYVEAGRRGGLASGVSRRTHRTGRGWRTVNCTLPPADYAQLCAVVQRDETRIATIVREAVQSYLAEIAGEI